MVSFNQRNERNVDPGLLVCSLVCRGILSHLAELPEPRADLF
jgi:hypothetical protein